MTLVPMYKICPKCKKRYSFNPDVGMFRCPRCYKSRGLLEVLKEVMGREKR